MNAATKRLVTLLDRVGSTKQGRARLSGLFERHGIEPDDGVEALVEEIQLDGANTLASVLRGWSGIEYDELVRDVASKVKAPFEKDQREDIIERSILDAVISKYLESASAVEREAILGAVADSGAELNRLRQTISRGAWTTGTLSLLVNGIGKRAVAELVKRIVLISAGKEVARQAALRAAAIASYAIPLLNVVMVTWTIVDIAGPAFRKTVPTVLEIAILRLEFEEAD